MARGIVAKERRTRAAIVSIVVRASLAPQVQRTNQHGSHRTSPRRPRREPRHLARRVCRRNPQHLTRRTRHLVQHLARRVCRRSARLLNRLMHQLVSHRAQIVLRLDRPARLAPPRVVHRPLRPFGCPRRLHHHLAKGHADNRNRGTAPQLACRQLAKLAMQVKAVRSLLDQTPIHV